MYTIKQCKAYMKKNGVKGVSKYNKQQLNTKILDVSKENYQTRKNIKQYTTTSLVFQLTKNENITNHIMSYLVNTTYYDTIKKIYSEQVLKNVLLCCLSRYEIKSKKYRCTDDSYAKETMYCIHDELFKKDPCYDEKIRLWNTDVIAVIEFNKNYCLGVRHSTGPSYVKEHSIQYMITEYNKIPYYFKEYATKK